MEVVGKLQTLWKERFQDDLPAEILARFRSDENNGDLGHMTAVHEHTKREIEDLKYKLKQEEFIESFLKRELEKLNSDSRECNTDSAASKGVSQEGPDAGLVYSKVNKPAKAPKPVKAFKPDSRTYADIEDEDIPPEITPYNPIKPECAASEPIDDGDYEEIAFIPPKQEDGKPKRSSSVRDKIQIFEKVKPSSSDDEISTEGAGKKPTPSRPSLNRRMKQCEEYEEIELIGTTVSFKDKNPSGTQVTCEANQPVDTSVVTQTADCNESAVNSLTSSRVNLVQVNDEVHSGPITSNDVLNSPKVKPGQTVHVSATEKEISKAVGKDIPELKFSDKEPKHTVKKDKEVKSKENELEIAQTESEGEDQVDFGEYVSIIDIKKTSSKHITQVNVSRIEEKVDPRKADNEKPAELERNISGDYAELKVEGGTSEEEMKKFFRKSSASEGDTVIVTKFRSLSETEPNSCLKRLSSGQVQEEEPEDGQVKQVVFEEIHSTENGHVTGRDKVLTDISKSRKHHVPDYEQWSINDILTKPGISTTEHLSDTASEDDQIYDNVDDSKSDQFETGSKHSADSGVCDTQLEKDGKGDSGSKVIHKEEPPAELDTLEVPGIDLRFNSASSLDSQESRASDISIPGDVFIHGKPRASLQEQDSLKSVDEDDVSICSLEDQLDKTEDTETERRAAIRAQKLHMRHLVVKGILESERNYLHVIDELVKAKSFLQTKAMSSTIPISAEDVTTIFYMLDQIYQKHKEFVDDLESKVKKWSDDQQIGECFKLMVFYFKLYEDYVRNYPKAVEIIHKYQEDETARPLIDSVMEPFSNESTKLEEILLKPVHRMQRNTLVLHDLIMHTPEDHPDYPVLQKALRLSEANLKNYNIQPGVRSCVQQQESRQLVKSGFVVEVINDKKDNRQLRYLFLFTDVILCTKHKVNKHKEASFKPTWSATVSHMKVDIAADRYSSRDSIEEIKNKIGNLKDNLKEEMKKIESTKDRPFSLVGRRALRHIEKLKKKIQEQEASLVEALPHLPLHLSDIEGSSRSQAHTLLFSTDYERDEWRESIEMQQNKCQGQNPPHLTIHEMEDLINSSKQHPEVNSIGSVLLRKDEEMLNGLLNVTIHKLHGLEDPCDTYCCLEMDSYGHFYKKAQTRICQQSADPSWDQDFELDLEGSQTLRILCFQKGESEEKDVIIGKCALELSLAWLKSSFREETISMNEISVTISIRHTPASKTLKRMPSKTRTGVFGVKLETITRREVKTIPSVVSMCVQQVEARGMNEVGIYRLSGVTSDIQMLKKLFDKNPRAASNQMNEVDINAITGALKLYFRELPEPLFTDLQYHSFKQTVELSDTEAKEKCMLELLHSLPDANYYTIVYMIEHLVRVSKNASVNKMSLDNLATIFGPTLLHPAVNSTIMSIEQMAREAQEAIQQSNILLFFLHLAAAGHNLRKSASSKESRVI